MWSFKKANGILPELFKAMSQNILIIEDEPTLAKALSLGLDRDFKVEVASTGQAGLDQALTSPPDLILLDIMLPDIDGIEILKKLKAAEPTADIPVIVLTNMGDKETVSRILSVGGTEYLIKSDWSIDEIAKKIRQTLAL